MLTVLITMLACLKGHTSHYTGFLIPPSLIIIDFLDIYVNEEESADEETTTNMTRWNILRLTMSDLLLLALPYLFQQLYLKSTGQNVYTLFSFYEAICKLCLIWAM